MTDLVQQLLEFERVTIGTNLNELIKYCRELNEDFLTLANSICENTEKWEYCGDLEGKLFRIYFANGSIIKIANGDQISLEGKQIEIFDIFSIFSLSRQQIETFLVCYHLYFEKTSIEEGRFRNVTYKLNGILRQLDLVSHIEDSDERKSSLIKEHQQTLLVLRSFDTYKKADRSKRMKLEKPKQALTCKKENLMKKVGLGGVEQSWRLYSNYAHSEYISDRQYNAFFREKVRLLESIFTTLNNNCRLTSKLIEFMCIKFTYIQEMFEELSDRQKLRIELWNKASGKLK